MNRENVNAIFRDITRVLNAARFSIERSARLGKRRREAATFEALTKALLELEELRISVQLRHRIGSPLTPTDFRALLSQLRIGVLRLLDNSDFRPIADSARFANMGTILPIPKESPIISVTKALKILAIIPLTNLHTRGRFALS